MSTERPLRQTATLRQIKPGPFRMWIPSVAERVQCWRKARSGPIAVPKDRASAARRPVTRTVNGTGHPNMRSLDFLVRCPPEIAWQILGYWRCQYPVDTQLIDQLGYR